MADDQKFRDTALNRRILNRLLKSSDAMSTFTDSLEFGMWSLSQEDRLIRLDQWEQLTTFTGYVLQALEQAGDAPKE